jgi:hypothetical protein
MVNLKSILNDTMRVKFDYYRDGCLWYSTINGFQFPVDITNVHGSAVFKASDLAKNFKHYIEKEYNKQKQ